MKRLVLVLLVALGASGQELVAKDSNGLIIEIKEKYGGSVYDTCTVVMKMGGNFIVVHKEGIAGYYPESFHSVRVRGKITPPSVLASNMPMPLLIKDRKFIAME
jgi:predicted ATP-grasp superfamily ATP-dependent carboligase